MNNTLVSICIPTYNGAKYILECLTSVCNQTVKDFEIIVCDDCSSDNTIEIVKTFQQNDARIKLFINDHNIGLVGNWERCIKLASNEWIKFVFQDDVIKENCIERFLSVLPAETGLIVCEREYIFEDGSDEEMMLPYRQLIRLYRLLPGKSTTYISPDKLSRFMMHYIPSNLIGEPTAIMFTRQCIKKYGTFNSDITNLMDLEFALRIGVNEGLIYIPEELIQFRVHKLSASQTNYSSKYFAAEYGDRIAFSYILLHDPRFVNFRKHNSGISLLRLKILMYYKVYQAKQFIQKNNNAPELLHEFSQLDERYKGVVKFANKRFLFLPVDLYFAIWARIYYYIHSGKNKTNTNTSG